MSSPLISVVNWGSALNFASHFFQSYSVPQYRARFCIVRRGTPSDESGTHSRSGHLVALTRRRRSVRSASEALKRNGRMSVPWPSPVRGTTSVSPCVMALTLVERAAVDAAARRTKPRRSRSGGFAIPRLLTSCRSTSPCRTRSRTAGQDPVADRDPHEAEDGPDEPRIDTVRGPESAAHPRGAAQYAEDDDRDSCPEQPVRDQPGSPQPERSRHDQHRARERR